MSEWVLKCTECGHLMAVHEQPNCDGHDSKCTCQLTKYEVLVSAVAELQEWAAKVGGEV